MSVRDVIYDFAGWLQKKAYEPPKIQYVSHVEGMEKWAPPVPTGKFMPRWFKELPKNFKTDAPLSNEFQRTAPHGIHPDFNTHNHTIKSCPGMQDILTIGYTMPFWANSICTVTLDGANILTHSSTNDASVLGAKDGEDNGDYCKLSTVDPDALEIHEYLKGKGFTTEEIGDWRKFQRRPEVLPRWKTHPSLQYSTMKEHLPEEWCKVLLKLETPWRVITPPGYSVLYMDPTYQFDPVLQAMPGILNTDYWNESNMFFFVKQKGIQFSVNFGDPLITHVPIKREKIPLEVRRSNEYEQERDREIFHYMSSFWQGSKAYRKALSVFGYTQKKQKKGECPFHKK
jgi:hypothetical protein